MAWFSSPRLPCVRAMCDVSSLSPSSVGSLSGRPNERGCLSSRLTGTVCGSQTPFPVRGAGAALADMGHRADSRQTETRLPAWTNVRSFGDKKCMRTDSYSGDATLSHSRGGDATAPKGIAAAPYNDGAATKRGLL